MSVSLASIMIISRIFSVINQALCAFRVSLPPLLLVPSPGLEARAETDRPLDHINRSFVMKYTVTKDAEAEIEFEGKEGMAGETPRTVVEVRPSDVASPRANATTMMKAGWMAELI